MKRILTFMLAILLLISFIPVNTEAADTKVTSNGFECVYEGDGVVITRYKGSDTTVNIPTYIDNKPVTKIGKSAFYNNKSISKVIIPAYVTSIEQYAFSFCSSLVNVQLSEGLTVIGDSAFSGCSSLVNMNLPDTVIIIGDHAFSGCSSWIVPDLPKGVKSLGQSSFSSCEQLTAFVIPEGIQVVPNMLLSNCVNLCAVTIPESVMSIGYMAFYGCKNLTSVTLPPNLQTIQYEAFENCKSLKSITIPDCVKVLGFSAFSSCIALTEIELPEGISYISEKLFSTCIHLRAVYIPKGVVTISDSAFSFCTSLTDIYFGGSEADWNNISFGSNVKLDNVKIHYNKTEITEEKDKQLITASDITKTYNVKTFKLDAKSDKGCKLKYTLSNNKVISINSSGKATIKGCGSVLVTISSDETDKYLAASKSIKVTIKPDKVNLSSAKSSKKKTADVKWKKCAKVTGYEVQMATDSKFKKNKVSVTSKKNTCKVKKLKSGKRYYVRVRAYSTVGSKVYGSWSKVKTVKVR